MYKLFIASDVHSYYDELMIALYRAGFDINNEKHIFVCDGDLVDRGLYPLQCIQFVNNLPDTRKILIRGNHEILAMEVVRRGYFADYDWHNGTAYTIQQLSEYAENPYSVPEHEVIESFARNPGWIKYYNSTVLYKEIGDYIFTHAWIPYGGTEDYPVYESNWKEKSFDNCIWKNGMCLWYRGVRVPNKTIVCGHWNSSWGNEYLHGVDPHTADPKILYGTFKDKGIIALDSMVPRSGFINVEVIEIEDDIMYI